MVRIVASVNVELVERRLGVCGSRGRCLNVSRSAMYMKLLVALGSGNVVIKGDPLSLMVECRGSTWRLVCNDLHLCFCLFILFLGRVEYIFAFVNNF